MDAILNSLFTTGLSSSSSGSYSGSSGGSDFFWPMDWDMDGGFSRKRRSADRQKRAAVNKMAHVALLGNCGPNTRPSILITANEQNVKMGLMAEGQKGPTELEIPLVSVLLMSYDMRCLFVFVFLVAYINQLWCKNLSKYILVWQFNTSFLHYDYNINQCISQNILNIFQRQINLIKSVHNFPTMHVYLKTNIAV